MLCRIAGNFPQIGEYASGQEVSADKVRCAVGGAFLVASADITVLLFSFVAYLGNWGYWKQDKYSETAYMEELEGEDRTFVLPKD